MKTTIIIIVIVILSGLGFWAMTNYQSEEAATNSASTTVNTTVNTTVSNTGTTENTLPPATNTDTINTTVETNTVVEVSIGSGGFNPSNVIITAGDTVTWSNEDSTTHYVAPNNHPSHVAYAGIWPDDGTGRINSGQTYSFTFDTPGTYDYHDHLQPSLIGTISVQ